MATIISTAVKLLLDASGFQAGIAQAVATTNAATVQINAASSASANFAKSLSSGLLTSGVSHLASELTKIHPLLGVIGASALFAATQINFAAVSQALWTAATWATTAATSALAAVGIPLWAGIAAAVAVAALAVWGLVSAYQAATGAMARSAEESEKLARAEAQREAAKKANASIEKDLMSMEAKLAGMGLSSIEKQIVMLDVIKGANPEQLKRARSVLEETEQRERQAEVMKQIAALEKRAEQSGMSPLEKTLSDLADSGAKPEQLEGIKAKLQAAQAEEEAKKRVLDMEQVQANLARQREAMWLRERNQNAQNAESLRRSLMTPAEQYEKKMQDIENLRKVNAIDAQTAERAGLAAMADFQKTLTSGTGRDTAGPKLLAKGSYEDEIAKNRQQNPIEALTAIEKQQLEQAQRMLDELRKVSENTGKALDELVQALF